MTKKLKTYLGRVTRDIHWEKPMVENEKRHGMLPQIIVAVVVALLVGGTSPWWWNEFFHAGREPSPQNNEPYHANNEPFAPNNGDPDYRPPAEGGEIQVRCTASPYSIPAGAEVEIRVLAFTEQNEPIDEANVRVEAGGGWFSGSGNNVAVGTTDAGGVFVTGWRAPNPAAREYGIGVTAMREGFVEGRGECRVGIE